MEIVLVNSSHLIASSHYFFFHIMLSQNSFVMFVKLLLSFLFIYIYSMLIHRSDTFLQFSDLCYRSSSKFPFQLIYWHKKKLHNFKTVVTKTIILIAKQVVEQCSKPQSIFLEGSLSHESQILVADSETRTEEIIDDDFDGTEDEPAVSFFFLTICFYRAW